MTANRPGAVLASKQLAQLLFLQIIRFYLACSNTATAGWLRALNDERIAPALRLMVILFNNAGVSSSSGEVPTTFEQMGANAVAFARALGLNKADMLGFSIGGMVAQEIALQAPDLVRKLIVVGTGPRGGQGMESLTQAAGPLFGATYDPPEYVWLAVQFSPSEAGQAAGREFLKRTHLRQEGRDPEVNNRVSRPRSKRWTSGAFSERGPTTT